MREEILRCIGKFPLKSELNLKIIQERDKGDYIEQLVEFNVEKNERVASYLLIPKTIKGKAPAILAIHQHAGNWEIGKSEVVGLKGDAMFSYGVDLVKMGFVVLAPDLLCFESRTSENFNKTREDYKAYERFKFCEYIQYGSSLKAKYTHDLSVAVDVLESLDYVNENIGALGHSMGGQESVWITWYDKRIKACVSSCGVGLYKSIFENEILHNYAAYIPGLGQICDMNDIIGQISPKPILLLSGLGDGHHFPLEGIEVIEEQNKTNPNFKSVKFDGDHKFEKSQKNIAYDFLNKNLK